MLCCSNCCFIDKSVDTYDGKAYCPSCKPKEIIINEKIKKLLRNDPFSCVRIELYDDESAIVQVRDSEEIPVNPGFETQSLEQLIRWLETLRMEVKG